MCIRLAILLLLFPGGGRLAASPGTDTIPLTRVLDINPRIIYYQDSAWLRSGICKPLKMVPFTGRKPGEATGRKPGDRDPILKIEGSIRYDYLFRSFADTPYYQKDFRQHTLQTSLTITVRNQYPLRVNFVLRKSNSPYFKNFMDGGMLFDRFAYLRNLQRRALDKIAAEMPGKEYLESAKALLKKNLDDFNRLKKKLQSPDLSQMIIEERERLFYKNMKKPGIGLPGVDKKGIDSLTGDLQALVQEKKRELDSLQQRIAGLQKKVDSLQNKISGELAGLRTKINKTKNLRELAKIPGVGIGADKKDKWGRVMSDFKTAGIGRSVVNYSELTARNVSLTGLNLEYNPRLYAALAVGKVDYGFRDFFGRNLRSHKQYLLMGRFGVGDLEKRAVIFSLYTGQKANYAGYFSDTISNYVQVTGYSVELIVRKDEHTSFTAEIAKSSRPVTGRYAESKTASNLFRFNDGTNLGISFKGETRITQTSTRLSATFRKTGENFQSFSLFNYNTDQVAWMAKVEQPLLKERVLLTGMLRKNDFVNPFTEKTYKTTTVFGSFQLSMRFPRWPSLTLGYYPGSQLYIVDRNRVRENIYYMTNGTLVHQYKLFGTRMVSSAIYNRYTSKGTDSGFINYRGINYLFSQSVLFSKLQLQGGFSYTNQQELQFYTADANADFQFGRFLKAGAGLKYNKIIGGNKYWGGQGQLLMEIGKLGSLQLQYEKSFLPTIQQSLFPVETGRLTWFKTF